VRSSSARRPQRCADILVQDDDVRKPHTLGGQVAVQIQLDADHAGRADDVPHPFNDVPLDVVVPVSDHRTVQPSSTPLQGHRLPHLVEDLVSHVLVSPCAPVVPAGLGGEQLPSTKGEASAAARRRPTQSGGRCTYAVLVRCSPGRRNTLSLKPAAVGMARTCLSVAMVAEKIRMRCLQADRVEPA